MWPGLVALLVLAGCDAVLGLKSFPDASPGAPDAPPVLTCEMTYPTVALCADFDETGPSIYVDGAKATLDLATTDLTATIHATSTTAPYALWLDDQGGTFVRAFQPVAPMTKMTASFDLQIAAHSSNPTASTNFVRLAALNTGLPSCYADFILDEAAHALRLGQACGSNSSVDFAMNAIPSDWFHVDFTLDLTIPRATITLNHTSMTFALPFGGGAITAKQPQIDIGISNANNNGLLVGYDTFVVTTQ